MSDASTVRFHFSFRSPYAWIAAERWDQEMGADVAVQWVPIYPTAATFPNDPTKVPNKIRYITLDVRRLAQEYGLTVTRLHSLDTDWAKAHAAYCAAEALGAGKAFMLEMFRARFSRGLDLGADDVIRDVAERSGLDPEAVLTGAADPLHRERVERGWSVAAEQDGVFGVPSFVYRGELFWGHDRMPALRRALQKSAAAE